MSTPLVKQIYQQANLPGTGISTDNSYFVIDMLNPAIGQYITYRVTTQQLKDLLQCKCVITVKTTITAAQLLNIFNSPVILVPSFGAGIIIQPFSFLFAFTSGTTPYNTNTTLRIKNGGPTNFAYNNSNILGAATSTITAASIIADSQAGVISSMANQNLNITSLGGNPLSGDGTLVVYSSFTVFNV